MAEKMKLQDICKYPIMNIKEAFDYLEWEYTDDGKGNYSDIKCCGELVDCSGFFDTEDLECLKCGKAMHDMFGVTPVSNVTATILNPKDFKVENGLHWAVINKVKEN